MLRTLLCIQITYRLYNISAKLTSSMLEDWLVEHAAVSIKLVRGKHVYTGAEKPSKTAYIQLETHAAAKELITRPVVRVSRLPRPLLLRHNVVQLARVYMVQS